MKVTVISIIIGALLIIPKVKVKGLVKLENRRTSGDPSKQKYC